MLTPASTIFRCSTLSHLSCPHLVWRVHRPIIAVACSDRTSAIRFGDREAFQFGQGTFVWSSHRARGRCSARDLLQDYPGIDLEMHLDPSPRNEQPLEVSTQLHAFVSETRTKSMHAARFQPLLLTSNRADSPEQVDTCTCRMGVGTWEVSPTNSLPPPL